MNKQINSDYNKKLKKLIMTTKYSYHFETFRVLRFSLCINQRYKIVQSQDFFDFSKEFTTHTLLLINHFADNSKLISTSVQNLSLT